MVEASKDEVVIFPPGALRAFIEEVEKKYHVESAAKMCSCSPRTIRDWRREKFNMPLRCVQLLSKHAGVPIPKNIKTRHRYAHVREAGKKGAQSVIAKYGRLPIDEEHRKRRWHKWWKKTGKSRKLPAQFYAQPIYKPRKSVLLAEFIGTMMGDGGMHRYQAIITLHHIDDRAYIDFVDQRIETLFRIKPQLYHRPNESVYKIVISRASIVAYLLSLGLPIGNKVRQQFDIPEWIKKSKSFSIACVRGLVDTDGSVFRHSYKVKRKWYHYKKLSFCSRSQPLQFSVARILTDLGMRPRISDYDVRLDSIADMKKYFAIVGSSNPKHLKRYAN